MKLFKIAAAAVLLVTLAGCAGSVSKPTALMSLTTEQQAIHISNITADAEVGVPIIRQDISAINQRVRFYIHQADPAIMVDSSASDALVMKIHYTRFDRGNAVARAIMIGLGQIHIDAVVTLEKADGTVVGKYTVKKTFALGGAVGALTTMEDVEDGFAKSVAEIVKPKTAS